MPRDGMKPRTLRQLALDIRNQSRRRLFWRRKGSVLAKEHRIDGNEPPGLLIGGAPDHDAVHMPQVLACFFERTNAPVEYDRQMRMRRFQPIDPIVIERRHLAVLFWR